tara:strand:- start:355 stop:1158 length:804 start_codon:yes stop_codon:yes gene_type:complete
MVVSKPALSLSALAFAALFGGGIYLYMNLNSIAKPIIENLASDALGVEVSIGDLDINLSEKKAAVKSVKIENVEGFQSNHILTVSSASVNLKTLEAGLVSIGTIAVDDINMHLDITEKGTNAQTLQKQIGERAAMKQKNAGTDDKTNATSDSKSSTKVMIDQIKLGKITLNTNSPFIKTLKPISIDGTQINKIGVSENGVTIEKATKQITSQLLSYVNKQASKEGLYKGVAESVLKEIGTKSLNSETKGKLEEFKNEASEKLKGLFN